MVQRVRASGPFLPAPPGTKSPHPREARDQWPLLSSKDRAGPHPHTPISAAPCSQKAPVPLGLLPTMAGQKAAERPQVLRTCF